MPEQPDPNETEAEPAEFTNPVEEQPEPVPDPSERLVVLAESLGLTETAEMQSVREELQKTKTMEALKPLYSRYQELGQELTLTSDSPGRAQVGLNINLARIWIEWGDNNRYIDALYDAYSEALHETDDPTVDALIELQANAEQERDQVKLIWEACADILDQADLDELSHQPFEQALGLIYAPLLAAGLDPDEFLAELGFGIEK